MVSKSVCWTFCNTWGLTVVAIAALFGIGILTVVIAVVSDGWESSYKKTLAKGNKRRGRNRFGSGSRRAAEARGPGHGLRSGLASSMAIIPAADAEEPSGNLQQLSTRLQEALKGADEEQHIVAADLSPRQLEDLPMELARAGMSLHDQANYFFLAQRDHHHAALSHLPGMRDFLPEQRARFDESQLKAIVQLAEGSGDMHSIQAAEHLLAMHNMEQNLSLVVKHAHMVRDTLAKQKAEIEDLRSQLPTSSPSDEQERPESDLEQKRTEQQEHLSPA